MHLKVKEKVADLLARTFSHLTDSLHADDAEFGVMHSGPGYKFRIERAGCINLTEAANELLNNQGWSERFSESCLRDRFSGILTAAWLQGSSNRIAQDIEQLVIEYEGYSVEQTVYVPLAGIEMVVPKLKVGRVMLKRFDVFETTSCLPEQSRVELCARIPSTFQTGVTAAEFRAIAEPTRARERALEEVRRILDLFRFSMPFVHPWNRDSQVGLGGEPLVWTLNTLTMTPTTGAFGINQQKFGHSDWTLDLATVEKLERFGFSAVSEILAKENPSDFEECLLRAVHWFAMSRTAVEVENRLLNLVTSIETFFTPKDRDPISSSVAEGVALFLGSTLGERKSIKARIKHFYSRRSSLSHAGKGSVLKSDLLELENYAGKTILRMIERLSTFKTRDDLLAWLEDERLS